VVEGEWRVPTKGSTSKMIFRWRALVGTSANFMTLLPGDVISTGHRRASVGMKPPQLSEAGDVVELGIDGLGESRQQVVDYR